MSPLNPRSSQDSLEAAIMWRLLTPLVLLVGAVGCTYNLPDSVVPGPSQDLQVVVLEDLYSAWQELAPTAVVASKEFSLCWDRLHEIETAPVLDPDVLAEVCHDSPGVCGYRDGPRPAGCDLYVLGCYINKLGVIVYSDLLTKDTKLFYHEYTHAFLACLGQADKGHSHEYAWEICAEAASSDCL